jgi:hypothetical protein
VQLVVACGLEKKILRRGVETSQNVRNSKRKATHHFYLPDSERQVLSNEGVDAEMYKSIKNRAKIQD